MRWGEWSRRRGPLVACECARNVPDLRPSGHGLASSPQPPLVSAASCRVYYCAYVSREAPTEANRFKVRCEIESFPRAAKRRSFLLPSSKSRNIYQSVCYARVTTFLRRLANVSDPWSKLSPRMLASKRVRNENLADECQPGCGILPVSALNQTMFVGRVSTYCELSKTETTCFIFSSSSNDDNPCNCHRIVYACNSIHPFIHS